MDYKAKLFPLLAGMYQSPIATLNLQWDKWHRLSHERSERDFVGLLELNARDEHKARAIAALLVPDSTLLPYKTYSNIARERFSFELKNIKALSEKVLTFMLEVIVIGKEYTKTFDEKKAWRIYQDVQQGDSPVVVGNF